jgi:hypothetical protein
MKIKKTISEKIISANRANSQKSTGPGDCANVKNNAMKHGFRAQHLFFENEDQKKEYTELLEQLEEYHEPDGPTEWMLVEEIANCRWMLQGLNVWKSQEITNRRNAAKAILRAVADNYDGERLSLFTTSEGADSAAQLGWDCQELVVRTDSRNFKNFEKDKPMMGMDKTGKSGQVQIEAKLNTSLDSILRYEAALKRDLYRALRTLGEIQRQRRGK